VVALDFRNPIQKSSIENMVSQVTKIKNENFEKEIGFQTFPFKFELLFLTNLPMMKMTENSTSPAT
jgi:hypothetical protein